MSNVLAWCCFFATKFSPWHCFLSLAWSQSGIETWRLDYQNRQPWKCGELRIGHYILTWDTTSWQCPHARSQEQEHGLSDLGVFFLITVPIFDLLTKRMVVEHSAGTLRLLWYQFGTRSVSDHSWHTAMNQFLIILAWCLSKRAAYSSKKGTLSTDIQQSCNLCIKPHSNGYWEVAMIGESTSYF